MLPQAQVRPACGDRPRPQPCPLLRPQNVGTPTEPGHGHRVRHKSKVCTPKKATKEAMATGCACAPSKGHKGGGHSHGVGYKATAHWIDERWHRTLFATHDIWAGPAVLCSLDPCWAGSPAPSCSAQSIPGRSCNIIMTEQLVEFRCVPC